MHDNNYNTLSQATNDLISRGYKLSFEVNENLRLSLEDKSSLSLSPKEVQIDEVHRFEGESNPADSSVIYALSTKGDKKGILIDSYGAKASSKISEFIHTVER